MKKMKLIGCVGAAIAATAAAAGAVGTIVDAEAGAVSELQRARELMRAGPMTIRCINRGAHVKCAAVADTEVPGALAAGDQALYGRTVYRGITAEVTDKQAAMFEPADLVCSDTRSDGTMSCSRVDRVQPEIPVGETVFVAYKRYRVTFDERGLPTFHRTGQPTVPLARAGG